MNLLGYSINDKAYIAEITEEELEKMGIPKSKVIEVLEKSGKSTVFLKDSVNDRITS
ncbi:MAG: hypothetical protein IJI83_03580 [Oscillospiraceae bacterium]|nr:hypothetical protein [Oscillospiraceae bacterium]